MRPGEFVGRMKGSVVERVRGEVRGSEGEGEYEKGMMVGTLVQNELRHISLMKE